jgi:hypothetical protein
VDGARSQQRSGFRVTVAIESHRLRHLASFEESWQVVSSPCCPRELPDVISENLSLDAGSHTLAVHRVLSACFFHGVIGLPHGKSGSTFRVCPANYDFSQAVVSRLQIFLNVPASKFARPQIVPTAAEPPQGSRGFTSGPIVLCYLHTHGYAVQIQVIDGTGTFTLSDSQLCRLLLSRQRLSPPSRSSRAACSSNRTRSRRA